MKRHKYVTDFRESLKSFKPKIFKHPYYGDATAIKVNGGPIEIYDLPIPT